MAGYYERVWFRFRQAGKSRLLTFLQINFSILEIAFEEFSVKPD